MRKIILATVSGYFKVAPSWKQQENNKKKYEKKVCIRKLYQERKYKGEFSLLAQDMKLYDSQQFFPILSNVTIKLGISTFLVSSIIYKKRNQDERAD